MLLAFPGYFVELLKAVTICQQLFFSSLYRCIDFYLCKIMYLKYISQGWQTKSGYFTQTMDNYSYIHKNQALLDLRVNKSLYIRLGLWCFNATFNNISVIWWQSVLLVEETRVPEKTTDLSQVTDKLYHIFMHMLVLIW